MHGHVCSSFPRIIKNTLKNNYNELILSFSIIKNKFARNYSLLPSLESNKNLNYYLAGLIEGDGTIIVPKTERDKKGRVTYPSIQIVFGLTDLPLALIIQRTLGTGSISKKQGKGAYIYTINSREGILKVISLVNGKFKTDKIYALAKLISFLPPAFFPIKRKNT